VFERQGRAPHRNAITALQCDPRTPLTPHPRPGSHSLGGPTLAAAHLRRRDAALSRPQRARLRRKAVQR
jgi:hypothetical protein